MDGRWELIEGQPYARRPASAPKHQKMNAKLWLVFNHGLEKSCKHGEAYLPIDWKVDEDTVVQPDLLTVCGEIKK